MKWTAMFFTTLFSLVSFATTDLSQAISIAKSNMTGSEFLNEISEQSTVKFVLDNKLQFSKKISMFLKEATLQEVMDEFAQHHKISWAAVDDDTIRISSSQNASSH